MTVFDLISVEQLRAGDTIEPSPRLGLHIVSDVREFDDGVYVVVYYRHTEDIYENRARDKSGHGERARLVERSLRPMHAGELVRARRGDPARAAELRAQMVSDQERRWAALETRREMRA